MLRQSPRRWSRSQPATGSSAADSPQAAAASAAPMAATAATTVARMAAAVAAAAISAVTTAGTAASAVQPRGQLGETTSPSAVQPLGQLEERPPPNSSTGAERPTSGDDIGEKICRTEISRAVSDTCVSGAARRSISPQSAGQLRPHQRRSIVRMRHHLSQELMPRSTAPAPLPPGHRTTAMDIRDLRRLTPAMHLPRRCNDHPDMTDHLHRRLPRNPTGASCPGNHRLYGHITSLQTSFRVRI